MRRHIREFVELCAQTLELPEPIYEFGALQTPGQEGQADLRPLFPGKAYVGCDMRRGPGVDRVLNLHEIELPPESVGSVLCLDTLEHVEYPRRALGELYRVLASGGVLLISSVMNFPIHAYPDDYWRFTPAAFRSLMQDFESHVVAAAGEAAFPHTVVGVAAKCGELPAAQLEAALRAWSARWPRPVGARSGSLKNRLERALLPFVPPILVDAYRRARRP